MKRSYPDISVEKLCRCFGRTRQTYYSSEQVERRKLAEVDLILQFIRDARERIGSKLGTKKLRKALTEPLERANIRCGRDRLYSILRDANLLRPRKRGRKPKLTDSAGWTKKWPDLRLKLEQQGDCVLEPERLWVADITYVTIAPSPSYPKGRFCFVSLITDAYSRKIVGYHASYSMHAIKSLKALTRALEQRLYPDRTLCHHSDRGSQYRADIYTKTLLNAKVGISMTESGSPYDNALAESVNGQLKFEYGLSKVFPNLDAVRFALGDAVNKYNNHRPHGSLDLATPNEVHAHPNKFRTFEMAWGRLVTLRDQNKKESDKRSPDSSEHDKHLPDNENPDNDSQD